MTADCQLLQFAFNNLPVRTVRHDGQLWFIAKDVCGALGMKNPNMAVWRLEPALKGLLAVDTPGGRQSLSVISEGGVHWLAMTARGPLPARFREWVVSNIVPFLGASLPLVLDEQGRIARRGMRAAALTDLEFQLLEMLHGRKRLAASKWLADNLRISDSALNGLVHRLRKKLPPLEYEIINSRAEFGENGGYVLSDLTAKAKGRAA